MTVPLGELHSKKRISFQTLLYRRGTDAATRGVTNLAHRYQPLHEARLEQPVLMLGFQAKSCAILMLKLLVIESQVSKY